MRCPSCDSISGVAPISQPSIENMIASIGYRCFKCRYRWKLECDLRRVTWNVVNDTLADLRQYAEYLYPDILLDEDENE